MKPLRLRIVTAGATDTAASLSGGMAELGLPPDSFAVLNGLDKTAHLEAEANTRWWANNAENGAHDQSLRSVPRKRKSTYPLIPANAGIEDYATDAVENLGSRLRGTEEFIPQMRDSKNETLMPGNPDPRFRGHARSRGGVQSQPKAVLS